MVIFKNVQRMEDVPLCNPPETYILNIKKFQDIIKNKNKCILHKKIVFYIHVIRVHYITHYLIHTYHLTFTYV